MKKQLINEVKQLQKIAGILKEAPEAGDTDYVREIMHWVKNMYPRATQEQFYKLLDIYIEQYEIEKQSGISVEDFLADLEDSSDPEAIIPIKSLGKYSGYSTRSDS
jgi:hypothetical protein